MIQMTSWLIASMLLGFIIAWFLSRIIYRRKQYRTEEMFDTLIVEQNNTIDELEKNFRHQRELFENLSNKLKDTEEALLQKTSLLTTLQNKIANSNSHESINLKLREKNRLLSLKNQKLRDIDRKRIMELKSFEEILLLAEDKIEESEKAYFKTVSKLNEEMDALSLENIESKERIALYEKDIKNLEEELKLYKSESKDPEFIISREQFTAVEVQLRKYQKEIDSLQNKNDELLLKLKKNDTKLKV